MTTPKPDPVIPVWTFADRLRKIRYAHTKLTQEQFAKALGVGGARFEAWESGRNTPRPALMIEIAVKIENLTGVPASWTLSG